MPLGSYVYRRILRLQPDLLSPMMAVATAAHERPNRK